MPEGVNTLLNRSAILFAFSSLAFVAALTLMGHHVAWTSWVLLLLILGNLTFMSSGLVRTRPRVANWLWAASIVIALSVIAAEVVAI